MNPLDSRTSRDSRGPRPGRSSGERLHRLGRRSAHAAAALAVLGMGLALAGFIRIQFNPTSSPFFWGAMPVSYVINNKGSDDVADLSDAAALRLALRHWENLPASGVSFVEDVAADGNRTDHGATDIHLLVWDESGATGLFPQGSGIVALTPILASTQTGQIIDADIVFNGQVRFSTRLESGTFDVQSIATHEVGHFIGLDHACGPLATMHSTILAGSSNVRSVSRDEDAGAAAIYPAAGFARGRITGAVARQGGAGLRFAQVVAIDEATGEVAAADLTDAAGNYEIAGLPGGNYSLYVEPMDGPLLPADTIAFQGQTVDTFATTWFPGGAVSLGAGSTASATWTAGSDNTLRITDATGGRFVAGVSGTMVLTGAGLTGVTSARVTGAGVTVTQVEVVGTVVRLTIAPGTAAIRGVRTIEVRDGAGRVATLTAGIDVLDPDPTLTSVTPTLLRPTGGDNLTLIGTNFVDGCAVVVGGQLATGVQFISATQLRAVSPTSPGTTAGVDVVVIRPDGREARALAAVTYDSAPVPLSIDPNRGPITGGTQHTITGTGFASGVSVFVGDRQASVLEVTATTIRITLPQGEPGVVPVTVTLGTRSGVLPNALTYVDAPAPVVAGFSPTSGPTAGGATVVITGSGFATNATVRFGASSASSVQVASPTQLTCVTPPGTGAVQVRVTNPTTGLAGVGTGLFSYSDAAAAPAGGGGGGGSSGCSLGEPAAPSALSSLLGLAAVALALVALRAARPA